MHTEKFSTTKLRHVTNVISGDELNNTLETIVDDTCNLLLDYCGPTAGFAAIFSTLNDGRDSTKFTKDGINIIRALEYANPLDAYVLSLLRYIGAGLEKAAGDGTTSSMILCAKVLMRLRKEANKKDGPTYRDVVDTYNAFVAAILLELDNLSINSGTDIDLVRGIGYHQALTSSHGDVELSELVSDLLASLPQRAWNHLIYRQEAIETDELYRVEINNSSYSCNATLLDGRMYNNELGNAVNHKSATLVVCPYELYTNSLEFTDVVELLEKRVKEDAPLVIVCPPPDSVVAKRIDTLYNEKRKEGCSITILWLTQPIAPRCEDSTAIFAICGIDSVTTEQSLLILEDIPVKFEHHILKLYNLVEYTPEGYHPDLDDPASAVSRFLFVLDSNIQYAEDNPNQASAKRAMDRLHAIRNQVEFSGIGNIVIGGQIYGAESARDILEDVLAATRESITGGCLIGGYRSLAQAISNCMDTTKTTPLFEAIADAFYAAILELNLAISDNTRGVSFDRSFNVITNTSEDFTKEALMDKNSGMVIQSTTSYKELLKRFGDIIPKIVCMTRMIVPNAIDESK